MFKKIIKFTIFCFLLGFLLTVGVFAYFAKDLPNPSKMSQRQIVESTKIFDRTGQVILYDIHGEEKRTVIPFTEIPQHLKDATLVIEDDNFYHHFGLDWKGILRAALANLRGKGISQGGSTITQQFIKNAYLGGPNAPRVFTRKIKELILSLELEMKYSKDEILGFYLNQVPYGSNAYGVEAAAQTFFNKTAKELTLAESALLAALPRAPSYYSPYGSHPEELKNRQEYILNRMFSFGYINEEELNQSLAEEISYNSHDQLKAHHFVTMINEYLEENYGEEYTDINKAGLKVYTTLDWDLQKIAEEVVTEGANNNEKKYNANNAALVATDPQTGQLLALVGSKNYDEEQFNVATSPYRQPGSSFKPFAYAAAFEKGFNSETILFDLPTSFGPSGSSGKEYEPKNYDLKFRGPITLRQALAQSINLPSVKVLYLAGVNNTINLSQDMGITTLKNRKNYGLSLVLGGGEIKLIDGVAAYSVFANDGIKNPLKMILKIEDNNGNILEKYQNESIRVISQQSARQINDILSDEEARAPMFGSKSKLYLPNIPAAAKTGTTQDYTDGWTIGYTPNLTVGVWAGNNEFTEKMNRGAAGIYVATPIWHEFMIQAYNKLKERNQEEEITNQFIIPQEKQFFNQPEALIEINKPMINGEIGWGKKVKIDSISNKLATDLTPPDLIEEKIYPEVHSILYYINTEDPLGDFPEDPNKDSQFLNWEKSVLEWVAQQPCSTFCYNQNPPKEYDDIHTEENQPEIKITSPKQGDYLKKSIINVKVDTQAPLGIKQLDFFINQELIGIDNNFPYSMTFNVYDYINNNDNEIDIKVRAYDKVLNRKEDKITVRINN